MDPYISHQRQQYTMQFSFFFSLSLSIHSLRTMHNWIIIYRKEWRIGFFSNKHVYHTFSSILAIVPRCSGFILQRRNELLTHWKSFEETELLVLKHYLNFFQAYWDEKVKVWSCRTWTHFALCMIFDSLTMNVIVLWKFSK